MSNNQESTQLPSEQLDRDISPLLDWQAIETAFIEAEQASLTDANEITKLESQGFTTEGLNLMGPAQYFLGGTVNGWTSERKDNPVVIELYDRLNPYRSEDWLASPHMDGRIKAFVTQQEIFDLYNGEFTKKDEFSPANIFMPTKLDFSAYEDFKKFLYGDLSYDTSDYNSDSNAIAYENLEEKIKQHPPLSLRHYIELYNSASEDEKKARFPALYKLASDGLLNEDGGASLDEQSPEHNMKALQAIVQAYVSDSYGFMRFHDQNTVNGDIKSSMSILRDEEYYEKNKIVSKTTFNIGALMAGYDLAHDAAKWNKLTVENPNNSDRTVAVDMDTYLFGNQILKVRDLRNTASEDYLDLDDTYHYDRKRDTDVDNYNQFFHGVRDADNNVIQDGLSQYLTSYNNASEEVRKQYFSNLYLLEQVLKGEMPTDELAALQQKSPVLYEHLNSIIMCHLTKISGDDNLDNHDVLAFVAESFVEQEYYNLPSPLIPNQDLIELVGNDEVTNMFVGGNFNSIDEDVLPVMGKQASDIFGRSELPLSDPNRVSIKRQR